MTDAWSPEQYQRFQEERSQPFYDLLALIRAAPGMRVLDLGCGTGELTRVLHEKLGARETVGIDSSPAMLAKAAVHAGPGLRFVCGDIRGDLPGPCDLLFSNAALQWVPEHEALFARLTSLLGERGQLAVQMPANHEHPSHLVATELAAEPPFAHVLRGEAPRRAVLPPPEYAALLHRLGFAEQRVRLEVYGHLLQSRDEVIEWVKGTLLTPYQARLGDTLYAAFLSRYRERLLPRLEDTRPYFYPFQRLLLWARR
jgi:trans-aconitate 2-methyltransferase